MTTDPGDDAIEGELMALSIRDQFFDSNFSDVKLREKISQLGLDEIQVLEDDIRRKVDNIQEQAENIRLQIYRLWQGKAWKTREFKSWEKYVKKTFPFSVRHSYKEIAAAKVQKILTSQEPTSDKSQNCALKGTVVASIPEITLRPLTPLLKDPELLKETFEKVVEKTDGHPTEPAMRAAVDEAKGRVRTDRERYEDSVKFFRRLNAQDLMIEKWGGIPAYTRDWSDAEVRSFRGMLKRYRDRFQEWIDDMSDAGLICDIDVSYSETES